MLGSDIKLLFYPSVLSRCVRTALVKDGWTITHDPLVLPFGERSLRVDLGAQAPVAAERDGRKIAVEIKSFVGRSEITVWSGRWDNIRCTHSCCGVRNRSDGYTWQYRKIPT